MHTTVTAIYVHLRWKKKNTIPTYRPILFWTCYSKHNYIFFLRLNSQQTIPLTVDIQNILQLHLWLFDLRF